MKFFFKPIVLLSFSLNFGCTTISKEYQDRRYELNRFCSIVKQDLPKQRETPTSKTMCLVEGYRLQKDVETLNVLRLNAILSIVYIPIVLVYFALEDL